MPITNLDDLGLTASGMLREAMLHERTKRWPKVSICLWLSFFDLNGFEKFHSAIQNPPQKCKQLTNIDTFTFPLTLSVDKILLCLKMFCYSPHPSLSSNILQVVQSYRRLLRMLDKNNLPQDFDPPPWMPKLVTRYIYFELYFNFAEWEKRSAHFRNGEYY